MSTRVRQGQGIALVMGASEEVIAKNAATQSSTFEIAKTEKDPAAAEAAVRKLIHEQFASLTAELK